MDKSESYKCTQCNKFYASYKSLWNHNKKFHTLNINKCNQNVIICGNICDPIVTKNNNNLNCKYCNKLLSKRHSKWRHEKKCKTSKNNETDELKKKIEDLQNQLSEFINSQSKNQSKSSQKINKQLINNGNNNNNGTIINNTFVKFGGEDLSKILNKKDMLDIISKNGLSLEESIITKIIHNFCYN